MRKIMCLILYFSPLTLMGQMMFSPDNQIRAPICPSAVFQREIVAWWMENHSSFGTVKTGSFILGFTLHDVVSKRKTGEIGGGALFKFENLDFWTETSFSFPFATEVAVGRDWRSSLGFAPTIKVYSQPKELLREEYYDPVLMNWVKNQTQINLDIGYSLQHQKDFYADIFVTNITRYVISGEQESFAQLPTYGINTAYLFGKKPTKIRLGVMAEMSGIGTDTKIMWLLRPNIQLLFLDEQFWLKYTLLKANSINKKELAHRFVIGLGSWWNINFAYTTGNSQIYRNSQGNFEVFMSWNLDKLRNPDRTKRAIPCSKKFKKSITKLFKGESGNFPGSFFDGSFLIKKIGIYFQIYINYPEGVLSQTLDPQILELYKSTIIEGKDYINDIYSHVEYYYKDKVKELFGDLVVA